MSTARKQHALGSSETGEASIQQPDAYSPETIRQLNALTSDFYVRETASFSATRQSPWHGWEEAWKVVVKHASVSVTPGSTRADAAFSASEPLAVLDLGCGNLRLERFLAARVSAPLRVAAFDNCPELAVADIDVLRGASSYHPFTYSDLRHADADAEMHRASYLEKITVDFQTLDLVESLLDGTFAGRLPHDSCDLAVAFGLVHHLPTAALRAQVLEGLLGSLKPGGFAIVSFWQFLNDPRLAAKAAATTVEGRAAHHLAAFQENDFLLGWQHTEGIYRFCHHTPEAEIDSLLTTIRESNASVAGGRAPAAPLPFREVARFSADGKQGNLNRYLILQRL